MTPAECLAMIQQLYRIECDPDRSLSEYRTLLAQFHDARRRYPITTRLALANFLTRERQTFAERLMDD